MPQTDGDKSARSPVTLSLSVEQVAVLERLADMALRTMKRANAALDLAFEEIGATKAYFAAKRGRADAEATAGDARPRTPGSLLPPRRG